MSDVDPKYRETYADDSPRGEVYPDDRTRLASVFDGESLKAVLYDKRECIRYRDETTYVVVLTPAGEARFEADPVYDWHDG